MNEFLSPKNFYATLAAVGFELVVDSALTMVFLKLTCWVYSRLLAGGYDREGVFGVPVQFRDDMDEAPAPRAVSLAMLDPYAIPRMTWGTAAVVSVIYNLLQTLVIGGLLMFLYVNTARFQAPGIDIAWGRIFFIVILVWVPFSYYSMALLIAKFLPTEYQKSTVLTIMFAVVAVVLTSALMLFGGLLMPFFFLRTKKKAVLTALNLVLQAYRF